MLNIRLLSTKVIDFFSYLIQDTIKEREQQNIVRADVMHLLIEAKKGNRQLDEEKTNVDTGFATVEEFTAQKHDGKSKITDDDIVGQVMIFFFAGFETVSNLMCFAAYELAANPDIQTRLREEVYETLENNNGTISYESLLKMKYMDMVICETLRKWPITVASDRKCTKPYTIEPTRPDELPVHLNVGDLVWIPLFSIHRDPEYYADPDRFDPERFNDENKRLINPYTYLPFGIGPRNCIGSRFALLETKMIIFNILRNFQLEISGKMKMPLEISKQSFPLTAEGGFWLKMKTIKSNN